jgi:hypothetical protein
MHGADSHDQRSPGIYNPTLPSDFIHYLVELLLEKGYQVHGMVRQSSTINTWRIDHLLEKEQNDRFS